MVTALLLIASFLLILLGAKLFTNAAEWTGQHFGLGEGAVGSLLAAVGTALPETMIAVVALFEATSASRDVAIGAIVGAPFMLATIAMVVVGVSAFAFRSRRSQGDQLVVDRSIILRDLSYFAVAFTLALVAAVIGSAALQVAIAVLLVAAYPLYFRQTLRSQGEGIDIDEPLIFAKRRQPNLALSLGQLVFSLVLIVAAAHFFVGELIGLADLIGVPPLVLSLVLAPLATELPEKANSVIWVRDGKDTLALGNITGAMVFQSTLPVSLGLVFTEWDLQGSGLVSVALAVAGAAIAAASIRLKGAITKPAIALAALLYCVFLTYVVVAAV